MIALQVKLCEIVLQNTPFGAWEISNVRPINPPAAVMAKRKIYFIEIAHP